MDIYEFRGELKNGRLFCLGQDAEKSPKVHISCAESDNAPDFTGSALCLGDFDGLHKGHMKLFELAAEYDKCGALIFDRNSKGSKVLTTLSEKLELLDKAGVSYVVITEFSQEFSKSTPDEFVAFLADKLKIGTVIAGYDYRFGYKASGDSAMLRELCSQYGICAKIAQAVTDGDKPIKSTLIRTLISRGDIKSASRLLGRCYTVTAEVVSGLKNGRKMGFPTANLALSPEKLLPPDGVYYGKICGRKALINIGKNPTFNAEQRTLEAHILDYSGDLYGKRVTAELIEYIRGEYKFSTPDALTKQISKDVELVKKMD